MLCANHSVIIDQIKVLLDRGQIELVGGAWWESILPIWPHDDQISQLQLSHERLKVLFGCEPQFVWLPERVWEPELADSLLRSNYKGMFLDDNGLLNAGDSKQDLHNVNYTSQGLKVLSIDAHLRQLIPWFPIKETLEYLADLHRTNSQSLAVFADDAEKFGSWPGTFQLIYEENYLDDFLTALEENGDWLQTVLPFACKDESQQILKVPSTSYPEMLGWSDGNWRNFLDRYHESRDMYETVLRAPRTPEALPYLLKAQCNDAYWHGVFGGLYLPHLREAVYGAVAKAYAASPESKVETTSSNDVILKNNSQLLGIRPKGGQVFQWMDLKKHRNWLATLRRYAESYRESEPADWYARGCGIEHFLGAGATLESIAKGNFPEEGDFVSEDWQIETQQNSDELVAILTRQGGVWQQGNFAPLKIKKLITMSTQGTSWNIQYEMTNSGERILDLRWGSEWNVSPSGSTFPERSFVVKDEAFNLEETHVWPDSSGWKIKDNWLNNTLMFSSDQDFGLWQVPFRTVSRQEGENVESIFQQVMIVMHRKVLLQPGQKYSCAMGIAISNNH